MCLRCLRLQGVHAGQLLWSYRNHVSPTEGSSLDRSDSCMLTDERGGIKGMPTDSGYKRIMQHYNDMKPIHLPRDSQKTRRSDVDQTKTHRGVRSGHSWMGGRGARKSTVAMTTARWQKARVAMVQQQQHNAR